MQSNKTAFLPPVSGIFSLFPVKRVPYIELARLNKPMAILNFALPALFGLLLAASIAADPILPPSQLLTPALTLLFAPIMVRCIACAFSDILDREADRQVSRTRLRPVVCGAISNTNGLICTAMLIALELACTFSERSPRICVAS